jgi:hypothetical protein
MMRFSAILAVGTALALASPCVAAVRTFTSASINSATSVNFDPAEDSAFDSSGASLELAAAGLHNLAYNNGMGFTVKPTTDDVFAAVSLAAGELKTKAVLGFGSDISGALVPINTRNGSASASVIMADSFTAYAGTKPFAWTGGTAVRFVFDLTGSSSIPEGLPSASVSKNNVYSQIVIRVYRPGGIDLYRQAQTFDFAAYPDFPTALAAFQALNAELTAKQVGTRYWMLGGAIVPWEIDPETVVVLDPEDPAHLEYEFQPGGDFEWILLMDTSVQLDASQQNVTVAIDLSHTVSGSYVGPEGTTTYSASGLFPDTTADSEIPQPICGDANGDGKITAPDALRALKAAVGGTPCEGNVCDVDASGKVTASDALKILRSAVGQTVELICSVPEE